MKWFTADTHFGHANIIKYCRRPFADVEEMDRCLIQYWNEVVHPNDEVHHLGDFAFGDHNKYLPYLNGTKHLVLGNHDHDKLLHKAVGWTSISNLDEVVIGDIHVVLCHYSMRVWNRSHHGSLQLYGHNHGNLPGTNKSCDVGVDCWNMKPIAIEHAILRMQGRA